MATTLHQVRQFALSLPETTEEPHFHLTSFRVKGKIFATAPPDGESLRVFVSDEERQIALNEYPDFLEELLWGKRVVGLSITLAIAQPAVVENLLMQGWARKAPKKLHASFKGNQ